MNSPSPSNKSSWMDRRGVGVKAKSASTELEREMERLNINLKKVGGKVEVKRGIIYRMVDTIKSVARRDV